jgi:3-methyladenine DNA glycosylase AlkC
VPTAEELISVACIERLSELLSQVSSVPSGWRQLRASAAALPALGLSDRARAVRDALLADVPPGFQSLADAIRPALDRPDFTGWMIWPVSEAVATAATTSQDRADFDDGLRLLAKLTPRLTGEFALRTFLNADLDRTLGAVRSWTRHQDASVRRLASEGTRPRLPWAIRVPEISRRPEVTVPVLDRLYRDESDVVRRSVANHLNDISRLDPPLAVGTAARWLADGDKHTGALVRHSMRTLIKQADPSALRLLGFSAAQHLKVTGPDVRTAALADGGELVFEASITNLGPDTERLAIDYVIHYRKANGSTAPKVFKLAIRSLKPGETMEIVRRQSFRPITTRKHYPGKHAIELQVNGTRHGRTEFTLLPPSG